VSATRASGGSTVEGGPLTGVRVVVTRAGHQAGPTVAAFEDAGARVALLPLLEVVPPEDPGPFEAALADLARFDWIAFTSSNAVAAVLDRVASLPEGVRLASVGGATSDALRERGVEPGRIEVEAEDSRAEGLAEALVPSLTSGARVLLPQAADARPALEEALRADGARPLRVDAYAKRVPPEAPERATEIFGTSRFGWVTFTSPSIARAFAELWGDGWPTRRLGLFAASIGPVTSAALRELGVEPAAEAESPGDEAMVAAVVRAVADRRLDRG
jgi:uroporphyrinogen-III synthase